MQHFFWSHNRVAGDVLQEDFDFVVIGAKGQGSMDLFPLSGVVPKGPVKD
jgi:hypothetical protein